MEPKVIGSFYFKKTNSGNLIGEFTNNKLKKILTESATINHEEIDKFEGEYTSSWHQNNTSILVNLTIKLDGLKYVLEWGKDNNTLFKGEGFNVNNILIGHYIALK
jgi:hypothetical protein